MDGKRVRVYLRTPLFRGTVSAREPGTGASAGLGIPPRRAGVDDAELTIDATSIVGTVVAERRAGLHLRVEELLDDEGVAARQLPFAEIVVPVSKIDYVVLTGD